VKRRLLKKVVAGMSHRTPARFRYNEKVKAAWAVRMYRLSPVPHEREGRSHHFDLSPAGEVTPCGLWRWCFLFEFQFKRRIIGRTQVAEDVEVSTVFLGLDHGHAWLDHGEVAPVVFESMAFGGPLNHVSQRYRTRAEALAGHASLVERCRAILENPEAEAAAELEP
jgi:hypothetical protein